MIPGLNFGLTMIVVSYFEPRNNRDLMGDESGYIYMYIYMIIYICMYMYTYMIYIYIYNGLHLTNYSNHGTILDYEWLSTVITMNISCHKP